MRSRLRSTLIVAIAAAAACLWPRAAHAQIEVAPALGMYFPLGGWRQVSDEGTGYVPRRRQLPAHMLAARFTTWASKRLAFEGTFAFSPSQVALSTDGNTSDFSGSVLVTSARALYTVASLGDGHDTRRETWDIIVGAGPGLVHRSGSAWENTSGVTEPALLLTAAVRMPLAGSVTWRVGLEDFISWTQLDVGRPSQTHARLHHDLIASLSVAVRVAGP